MEAKVSRTAVDDNNDSGDAATPTAAAAAADDKTVKTFLRYYHVFDENELFALCSQFDNIVIEDSYYDQGNWCIIFRKTARIDK